jgi:hypothetical protein
MFDFLTKKFDDFMEDPVGEVVHNITAPVRHSIDLVDGLTEGELRVKAALSLGADVASGMAASELIEWYSESL